MRYALIATIAGMMILLGGCGVKQPEALMHQVKCDGVYAMKRGECIALTTLVQDLEPYRVIFLGDHHDSEAAHAFAVELMDALAAQGHRIHLANEWFTPSDNALLSEYAAQAMNDGNFTEAVGWKQKAGFDFKLFAPLYHAVQRHEGSLYGINLTRDERKLISDANVSGMSPELKRFFEGLDTNVSAHRQLLKPYLDHCKQSANCAERMMRVQTAWDTKMAVESHKLLKTLGKEEKLIVFAGSMHFAHGLGIGMRFARISNEPYVTVLPALQDAQGYPNGVADYLYLYTAPEVAR